MAFNLSEAKAVADQVVGRARAEGVAYGTYTATDTLAKFFSYDPMWLVHIVTAKGSCDCTPAGKRCVVYQEVVLRRASQQKLNKFTAQGG